MINEFSFIRIYKSLAKGKAETKELLKLYDDLQAILGEDTPFAKWFKEDSPDRLGAAIAIDAVAHAIHAGGDEILQQVFPDAEYSIFKEELDKLSGLEKNSQIRQYNRGYFTTLLADDSVFLIEKELTQVGRTTREAILPAIKEYEKLYRAGLVSPAELLTLSRYFPENEHYRASIIKLGLDNEDNHPVVVGGPASVEMIDREGHLITTEALDKAFTKFMANFRSRNLHILHSDVKVGWILPAYLTRDGRAFSSGVDDKQLWVLGEIRGDTRIAKRVAQEVIDKNLRSYSIAGSALDVQDMQKGAISYKSVNSLELSEITLCLIPGTKIWTKAGLKEIKDVSENDLVYTYENRWRSVTHTFERDYDGKIYKLTFSNGQTISATPEHPIRTLVSKGKDKGVGYKWVEIKNLKIGNSVSSHIVTGFCNGCQAPLFKKINANMRTFCCRDCRTISPGNRSGKTLVSGDPGAIAHSLKTKGVTKLQNPNLSGGIRTPEGRARQHAGVTSDEFRKKRSDFQIEKCKDPEYLVNVLSKGGKTAWRNRKSNPSLYAAWRQSLLVAIPNIYICKYCGKQFETFVKKHKYCSQICAWSSRKGSTQTPEANAKRSAAMNLHWQDQDFAQKMLKSFELKPNKLELYFENILHANGLTNWKYVGDGQLTVGWKCPDFWNGDKKLIELYGDYWHRGQNPQDRIDYFEKFGYETIVIWEKDTKTDLDNVLNLVKEFDGNALSKIVSIDEIDYVGKVYNLEVEEDNSYTTEACVTHNCERGMNSQANFDIIKSETIMPTLEAILSSFKDELSPFSGAQIYVENSGEIPSVIIKADKYNSIIDMLVLELQKMLPENTSILVKYDVSDAIPVYKMQLVPIWTTPQTQREADHSFPAGLGEDVSKALSYEEESDKINESKETDKAKNSHKFSAAEWTHKNGHPRCKICGMEEGMTKTCPGLNNLAKEFFAEDEIRRAAREKVQDEGEIRKMGKATQLFKNWLNKENKELDSPGKKVLHDFAGRQKKLRQLLDEQGMPADQDPKDADKRRDVDVAEDNSQPWVVSEAGTDSELSPEQKKEVRAKHKVERFDN